MTLNKRTLLKKGSPSRKLLARRSARRPHRNGPKLNNAILRKKRSYRGKRRCWGGPPLCWTGTSSGGQQWSTSTHKNRMEEKELLRPQRKYSDQLARNRHNRLPWSLTRVELQFERASVLPTLWYSDLLHRIIWRMIIKAQITPALVLLSMQRKTKPRITEIMTSFKAVAAIVVSRTAHNLHRLSLLPAMTDFK